MLDPDQHWSTKHLAIRPIRSTFAQCFNTFPEHFQTACYKFLKVLQIAACSYLFTVPYVPYYFRFLRVVNTEAVGFVDNPDHEWSVQVLMIIFISPVLRSLCSPWPWWITLQFILFRQYFSVFRIRIGSDTKIEVLDVLLWGLKASPIAWTSFKRPRDK